MDSKLYYSDKKKSVSVLFIILYSSISNKDRIVQQTWTDPYTHKGPHPPSAGKKILI